MRVRRISADQRAVERVVRDRVQLVAELDGLSARFDDREGAAGEADDIGVRRVVAAFAPAWGSFLAEDFARPGAPPPAVAIPVRIAPFHAEALAPSPPRDTVVAG